MKELLKKLVKALPIAFTKNQQYDKQTAQVIRKVCKPNSNCVDIGCHKGEVLDVIRRYAPQGQHFGFEPIPVMYHNLVHKYSHTTCHIYDIALSNEKGETQFNFVVTNPAYSGLIRRKYDKPGEQDQSIKVKVDLLDNIIPLDLPISLIKIDVEGGELGVLQGAVKIIRQHRPVIIFEHGVGASDCYGTTPQQVYQLLQQCGLKVSTMKRWLEDAPALMEEEFAQQFYNKLNYYFIAYP